MPLFKNNKTFFVRTAMIVALGITGLSFHAYHQEVEANTPATQAPQVMSVTADRVKAKPVQIWKEFSTHMAAVDFAEIRPQVTGNITEIRFEDGKMVVKDDVLFVIDPRPFQASEQQARAELGAAQNDAKYTQKELLRAQSLIKTKAISQRIYDERENTARVAKTVVAAAKARLTQAQINLDHAFVKAPISGRVSRAEITIGNLVETGSEAPVLTSIVSSNGIYADFDVDEQTYLTHIRSVAKNIAAENAIPVKLSLGGGSYVYEGFVHSFDNQINTASGTIRARAYFSNDDKALLPGMFGKLQLGSAVSQEHILISEKAIGTNQDRKFVYVVNDTNKVVYREVIVGNSVNGKRIIRKGLQDGDLVITEGIIRIRPGMLVEPKIVSASLSQESGISLTQVK
jgi:membrane fusion protein, multidrug efflux system